MTAEGYLQQLIGRLVIENATLAARVDALEATLKDKETNAAA